MKTFTFVVVVGLVAVCGGAELSARVWRGETAYVDVPAQVGGAILPQNGAAQGGVEIRLAYYDEVAYETITDNGMVINKRPDVYREIAGIAARVDARPPVRSPRRGDPTRRIRRGRAFRRACGSN